jgi:hypothetical protein
MLKLSSWRKSGGAFPTRRSGISLLISARCSIGNQAQPGAGESRQQSGPERDQEPQAQESGVDLSDIDFVASFSTGTIGRILIYALDGMPDGRSEPGKVGGCRLRRRMDRNSRQQDGSIGRYIPLAPALRAELEQHRRNYPDGELIFPGRSHQTKGRRFIPCAATSTSFST